MNLGLKIISIACIAGCSALFGCLDPYEPPTSNVKVNFLVVDGHINSTDSIATVKLSRAIQLNDTSAFPTERDATVTIEDETGYVSLVLETGPGIYSIKRFFDQSLQYRLMVMTSGKEYASEFIDLQQNTPIDSLSWNAFTDRLEIYANTHDFREGFKYYRYSYDETYEYNSTFYSGWKLEGSSPVFRPFSEQIYTCWITSPSTNILLTSTESLAQNVIANQLLLRINKGDRRLWRKHSLFVRQNSLSKQAYDYWTQVKKMSESLGGLFDPLPHSVKGNISSISNPDETVLGYFSGGQVSSQRIVIRNNELPRDFSGVTQDDCLEQYIEASEVSTLQDKKILITRAEYMAIFIVGFHYSIPSCVDCQLEGGTRFQPEFMR